ncbi:hypothetical protein LPB142_05095 [Rhodobacter xanthinilyticus]|uniref:Cytochrome c domain-containing protein n=1 Tax=Rhodobacter xanthinilyticus TaxID=1850250 RepID=A0A1D9MA72_9RHOB|nr:hypothetical protein [Rhodobacter xanthinilyticus]AOZ68766.1 hypothetical protein LPB142_05095 [Rhodobacter xanthinilyticus]
MTRLALLFATLTAASGAQALDLGATTLSNRSAHIPPQCYTKTTDAAGAVHNPCQTCHVLPRAPNYTADADLQTVYAFPAPARVNPWTNLFADRRAAIATTPAPEIDAWVAQDNYRSPSGKIALAEKLAALPADWDSDGDGKWAGYVPDIWFDFDEEGFDRGPDGRESGWRAFAYHPLPGSFWPMSGSTDDVMIRLPEAYRRAADGTPSRAIYKLNLAITEALIKRADIAIAPTEEAPLGLDLDRDGRLGRAEKVAFDWDPLAGREMRWVGQAATLPAAEAPIAAGLYPLGTEFLHSVRYLSPEAPGQMAPRMKELRYMRKTRWQSYYDREDAAHADAKERRDFPDRLAQFFGSAEEGISNGTGWRLQGFIEDAAGDLRPQSFEETVFCMGCHGGIGATDDDTFAFPRKLGAEAFRAGWYHWSQRGFDGGADLIRADGTSEAAHYLRANGGADDLGATRAEVAQWLADNALAPAAAQAVGAGGAGLAALILPDAGRARALDVAYREVVREQSFTKGRDAVLAPMEGSVWRVLEEDQPTGVAAPVAGWFARAAR